jgi:hypothetical protein
MPKRRSFEMDVFRRLAHEERAAEANRLAALIKKYRVPARIRQAWRQRIELGSVFVTGPEVLPYEGDKLPWED